MAATGGLDWQRLYHLLEGTGKIAPMALMFFIAFFHFALFNVLTGMFVEYTIEASRPDQEQVMLEQRRKEKKDIDILKRMCDCFDVDGSGTIALVEVMSIVEDT